MLRALVVLVLLALTVALPAEAGAATKKPALRVTLLDGKQRTILKRGALPVRVTSRRAMRVRVTATGARPRVVRFRKAGSKRVRLRLTRTGRRALARCVRRTLTVRARRVGRKRPRAFVRTTFQRDRRRCPGTNDPPPLVVGSSKGGPGAGTTVGGRGLPGGTGKLDAYADADRCDPLDPSLCLQPWPNDHFTRADPGTDTRLRLNLKADSMPKNRSGKPVDPTDQNRNDGFSPGNLISTLVPGLDFGRTGIVPLSDIARYDDADAPAVVIDAVTHRRWPIWGELDVNPESDADRNLILRPAVNFTEGHRYVVALRRMRTKDGSLVKPSEAFRFFRDGVTPDPGIPAFENRRASMERLFGDLARAGIERSDLYLAWDFTVASERNLSERVLRIRDDAFKRLGDENLADLQPAGSPPPIQLNPDLPDLPINDQSYGNTQQQQANQDGVQDFAPCTAGQPSECEPGEDRWIQRQIRGQITVPCYLDRPGCPPGSRFTYPDAQATQPTLQPISGNTATANFTCNIPRSASGLPARPSLYGHGLLGSANGEINQTQLKAFGDEHNLVFCGTDWIGMSRLDIPNVAGLLSDVSNFSTLVDRSQQGFVNQLYLGRAMVRPDGLCAQAPFQRPNGGCYIDWGPGRLFYDGNSQGGILGGALTALAVDHDRATLGVPGMNFSTLLRRSVDFNTYSIGLYNAYPNERERPLLLSLMQLLWDRGEANGYAHHMTTDPLANTPQHRALLHVALGDHQVANISADVEARTIGAATTAPPAGDRLRMVTPLWGIPRIGSYPYDGSGIVYWDSGTPPPPLTEVPPTEGADPHEVPRNQSAARAQKSAFLQIGGRVVDVCGGGPCKAADTRTTP